MADTKKNELNSMGFEKLFKTFKSPNGENKESSFREKGTFTCKEPSSSDHYYLIIKNFKCTPYSNIT